jgi:hypothetical protein
LALDRAMAETAGSAGSVEEAMQAAAKHDGRSEQLAALVAEAKGMVEQARAAEAERAKVAAEVAAEVAAAAVEAAERLRMEEEMAALTLSVQSEMLRLQQVQAQLGHRRHPWLKRSCACCAWTRARTTSSSRAATSACVRGAPNS